MKPILKKMLRALLIFVISAIIIYLVPTLINFNNWCKENQLNLFMSDYYDIRNIDSNKIQNIGDSVSTYLDYHSLAEYFNPLGFSVWSYMQEGLNRIFTQYIVISILSGIAIVIAYIIITSKKMNNMYLSFNEEYYKIKSNK